MNKQEFVSHISNSNLMNGVKGSRDRIENVTISAEKIKDIWRTLYGSLSKEDQIDDFTTYAYILDRIQDLIIKKS